MNCRRVEKILPELVAGELDDLTAKSALEHIRSCESCAREQAKYEKILGAASQAWETLDEPQDLVLSIPDGVNTCRPRRRLTLAACALAAILVAVIVIPRTLRQPGRQNVVTRIAPSQDKPADIKHPPVKEDVAAVPRVRPVTTGVSHRSRPNTIATPYERPATVAYRHRASRRYRHDRTAWVVERPVRTNPQPTRKANTLSAQDPPPNRRPEPIVVVASWVPDPPTMVMESVDHATGEVSIHQVTYSSSGKELESEIRFTPRIGDDRRDDL